MYTEYVFDDKKYEVASKNLKSILFDVVNAESSKLADIREKIAEADESDLRSKMIELCDKHERTLLSILNVSNKLNETLQSLDSFSRDLRFLENESLAEIVSHYVEQQNAIAAEHNASYIPEQENSVDPITDAVDSEKVEYNEVEPNDSIEDVIARSTGAVSEPNDLVNQEIVEEGNEDVNVDSPVTEEQVDVPVAEEQVDVPVVEEQVDVPVAEEQVGVPVAEEQVDVPVAEEQVEAPVEEDVLISDSNIVENANNTEVVDEEAAAPIIESSEPVFPVTEEEKKEETITDIFGLNENGAVAVVDNPIAEKSSDEAVPITEKVSSDEQSDVQVQDPVIPVVNEAVGANDDKSDELGSVADETVNSDTAQNVVIPEISGADNNTQGSTLEKQEEVVPEVVTDSDGVTIDESEIITFVKADNNQPRAILTTANQISKLRESKGTNESLLIAKQFFKFANQTEAGVTVEQPVSESVEIANEGDVAVAVPTAVETANSVAVEQPVAENNSNVIPFPVEKTKEEQMEEMMQQITELYNEGKVDEAQALSDKVSELNKELQQEQKVLVA